LFVSVKVKNNLAPSVRHWKGVMFSPGRPLRIRLGDPMEELLVATRFPRHRKRCFMTDDDVPADPQSAEDDLSMSLLAAGIPLTLLLDLAESFGPPSAQILAGEDDVDPSTPTRVS